jgi:hypothetical protein
MIELLIAWLNLKKKKKKKNSKKEVLEAERSSVPLGLEE